MSEQVGLPQVKDRFADPSIESAILGLFPEDDVDALRFSINYFTAIDLGPLTDTMRERIKLLEEQEVPVEASSPESESETESDKNKAAAERFLVKISSRKRSRSPRFSN